MTNKIKFTKWLGRQSFGLWLGFSLVAFCNVHFWEWRFWVMMIGTVVFSVIAQECEE